MGAAGTNRPPPRPPSCQDDRDADRADRRRTGAASQPTGEASRPDVVAENRRRTGAKRRRDATPKGLGVNDHPGQRVHFGAPPPRTTYPHIPPVIVRARCRRSRAKPVRKRLRIFLLMRSWSHDPAQVIGPPAGVASRPDRPAGGTRGTGHDLTLAERAAMIQQMHKCLIVLRVA